MVLFAVTLSIWEIMIRVFEVEEFILPAPTSIAAAFVTEWPDLREAGVATFLGAMGGLVVGGVVAVAAAMAAARWAGVRSGAMPLAIAANSTPIVVLAPIANAWFGLTSWSATITVVAVLVFFPIMINLVRGLLAVSKAHRELMASYASDRRTVLWKVQMPTALPYFFSALKVAAALSLIGAIVKEYFGGPQARLGQYITTKAALFQFEEAWSAIVLASLIGVALYGVIVLVERRMMPWHVSVRGS
jgi:NitT/TauT family transport system permease protein